MMLPSTPLSFLPLLLQGSGGLEERHLGVTVAPRGHILVFPSEPETPMDTAMDTAAGLFESPLTALIRALKFFFLIFDNGLNPEK